MIQGREVAIGEAAENQVHFPGTPMP
jgi:hypothetical protein